MSGYLQLGWNTLFEASDSYALTAKSKKQNNIARTCRTLFYLVCYCIGFTLCLVIGTYAQLITVYSTSAFLGHMQSLECTNSIVKQSNMGVFVLVFVDFQSGRVLSYLVSTIPNTAKQLAFWQ